MHIRILIPVIISCNFRSKADSPPYRVHNRMLNNPHATVRATLAIQRHALPMSLVNACRKAIGSLPYTITSALSTQGALARSRKSLAFDAAHDCCQRHGHLK